MHRESIFLVGPMGAGKSTVGKLLAEKLHYDFVDSDHEIEARTGATIPMIFDIEGESGFRDREELVIDELSQRKDVILATGGGVVEREANRQHLRSRGFVVYLKSSVDSLIQRTRHDRSRPLLQTENPEQVLTELMQRREPWYLEMADMVVETQQVPVHRVVKKIYDRLQQEGVV
ncbi:shikimate kinase AroK [Thiomicrorhabdus sp. 6S3-12]|uniref:shikimate kinase AroK n=1 Tax=Thiomicrorhabdus sp. 6S3-12 TaxID=2819681 RepID=UPI001ACDCF7D|nr:shikimate kinase AroK [Thiomicrorhabdus sp. 6S3-12]MBO1923428.1 shikimate kinase AroK [Thiomicrorhabdus sp. 6S3-12]